MHGPVAGPLSTCLSATAYVARSLHPILQDLLAPVGACLTFPSGGNLKRALHSIVSAKEEKLCPSSAR